MPNFLLRPLPGALEPLATLALDLRWTWSHAGDAMWRRVNPEIWGRTQNPWVTLQESSQLRLDQVARDPAFQDELQRLQAAHQQYVDDPAWYGQVRAAAALRPEGDVRQPSLGPVVAMRGREAPQDSGCHTA